MAEKAEKTSNPNLVYEAQAGSKTPIVATGVKAAMPPVLFRLLGSIASLSGSVFSAKLETASGASKPDAVLVCADESVEYVHAEYDAGSSRRTYVFGRCADRHHEVFTLTTANHTAVTLTNSDRRALRPSATADVAKVAETLRALLRSIPTMANASDEVRAAVLATFPRRVRGTAPALVLVDALDAVCVGADVGGLFCGRRVGASGRNDFNIRLDD